MFGRLSEHYEKYTVRYSDAHDIDKKFSNTTKKTVILDDDEKYIIVMLNLIFGHDVTSISHIKTSDVTKQCFRELADLFCDFKGSYKFYLASTLDNGTDVCKLNLIGRCTDEIKECKACKNLCIQKSKLRYWRDHTAIYDAEAEDSMPIIPKEKEYKTWGKIKKMVPKNTETWPVLEIPKHSRQKIKTSKIVSNKKITHNESNVHPRSMCYVV